MRRISKRQWLTWVVGGVLVVLLGVYGFSMASQSSPGRNHQLCRVAAERGGYDSAELITGFMASTCLATKDGKIEQIYMFRSLGG